MIKLIEYFTNSYSSEDEYIQTKAIYTVIFTSLLISIIVLVILVDIYLGNFDTSLFIFDIIAALIFTGLLFLIKNKHLNLTVNILIIAGLIKIYQYLPVEATLLFYLQCTVVLIGTAAIHIHKKQLYLSFIVVGLYNVFKLISRGAVSYDSFSLQTDFSRQISQSSLALLAFSIIVLFYSKIIDQEIAERKELKKLSVIDPLTGLSNRGSFNNTLSEYLKEDVPFVFSLIDIDHFKYVNDNFGHNSGDHVLKDFSSLLMTSLPQNTSIFRWGGEEFAILMPHTSPIDANNYLESFRQCVDRHCFIHEQAITFSAGVTCITSKHEAREALQIVDEALYQAKSQGRNQTVIDHC